MGPNNLSGGQNLFPQLAQQPLNNQSTPLQPQQTLGFPSGGLNFFGGTGNIPSQFQPSGSTQSFAAMRK